MLSFETVFNFGFNHDSDYVIWKSHCHNIWYGYYLKPFFNVDSTVMVIRQSGNCTVTATTYDIVIIWNDFQCGFNYDDDYVIQKLHCHNTWYGYYLKPFFNVMDSTVIMII
jgi:hypothetical protein